MPCPLYSIGGHGLNAGVQTGVTTGVTTGTHRLYGCLLMQLGMLQYKLNVIMMTIIVFSISNISPNWQITKNHQNMKAMRLLASVKHKTNIFSD